VSDGNQPPRKEYGSVEEIGTNAVSFIPHGLSLLHSPQQQNLGIASKGVHPAQSLAMTAAVLFPQVAAKNGELIHPNHSPLTEYFVYQDSEVTTDIPLPNIASWNDSDK